MDPADKVTKRQWMQSVNGKIRVGPQYQAMIPPFCRIGSSKDTAPTNGVNHYREKPVGPSVPYSFVSENLDEEKAPIPRKTDKSKQPDKHQEAYIMPSDFLISH
ncbi:mesoderm induction early response factor, putative [Babesia ovis]|uniref:Mesoderm induction early response factor, putative n=1 Tax=Babesia ovis TaxID=5869 RepID=A0A9W5T9D2_BABOV|nr:mesoderm induction early response factor, putative [Babesia ovis]